MTKLTINKSWAFMAVLLVVTALALHAYLTERSSTGLPNINPAPEVTLRSMPNFTSIQDVKEKTSDEHMIEWKPLDFIISDIFEM